MLLNTPNVDSRKKIQVQCNMNLSQQISNPNIRFDIDFPTLDHHGADRGQIRRHKHVRRRRTRRRRAF